MFPKTEGFDGLFLDDAFALLGQDLLLDLHGGEGIHEAIEDGLYAVHRHAAELTAAGVELCARSRGIYH